jgi:hypothetical protein
LSALQGIGEVNGQQQAVLLQDGGKREKPQRVLLAYKKMLQRLCKHGPGGKNMSDSDGIQISDKPSWEHTSFELWVILGKRIIALPSKMLGFKPFCLYLATWLLVRGYIKDWIWFAVMVAVLFGIVGLKVITRNK